ncbi:MAG: hypothetical protein K2G19_12590, partial [Lachnospiraceae bacterium]|nr:hypothetical protein [Lachnospiraceae bacterium]
TNPECGGKIRPDGKGYGAKSPDTVREKLAQAGADRAQVFGLRRVQALSSPCEGRRMEIGGRDIGNAPVFKG